MPDRKRAALAWLMAATALASTSVAHASTKPVAKSTAAQREAALVARLEKLEAEIAQLRGQAANAKAETVAVAQAASAADAHAASATQLAQSVAKESRETSTRLAVAEKKPQPEGMRVGSTTVKIGGFLKLNADSSHYDGGAVASNTLGRDFYLPQTLPVASATSKPTTDTDFSAKQTRLWLNIESQVAGHVVKGYLETDFQTTASAAQNVAGGGSQRTTNGYTLALRRAFVQFDKWTFGQDWTTFQYTAALPESTDFVGATEGTVFIRQPLIRYSTPLGKGMTLHLAAENPESATATAGSATLVENGTDHVPDAVVRLAYASAKGELSVAGIGRQIRAEVSGAGVTTKGYGISTGAKYFLNANKTSDLRLMATYGQGIGRYVGLNFSPDAVYMPTSNSLANVKTFAALAAAHVAISPTVRVNLIGSMQAVSYDSSLSAASIAAYNKKAWSGAINLFYSPVKMIDLGIEYRHGERELVSGAKGSLDRFEFAAKYNF
ncbi:hypothetical protein EOE18_00360 [Novosphingobium umbonatum]|uniref:Uncharacterized protein n=1 Tax=Novosphingobium umbonatum TaxID=1908524 RepID=A0A437NCB1_9SPHN|nr:DcaP family trimeric outer membrane transporter [Novosphingobium umbonatum]RVU07581.1 hypothetical protein EOE18_00360 [Novosphingobium umbonatum]